MSTVGSRIGNLESKSSAPILNVTFRYGVENLQAMRLDHLANAAIRAAIPFPDLLRQIKHKVRPPIEDPTNTDYTIENGLDQICLLRDNNIAIEGATVLEIGSGWDPLIPVLFSAAGARHVVMTDVVRLMDHGAMDRAADSLTKRADLIASRLGTTPQDIAARLRRKGDFSYLTPWDAARHPEESVDILLSRAVLEHIPVQQLETLLSASLRLIRRGGVTCHVIDNSDHWEHRDKSLSRVEFLRYEESDWKWRLAQVNIQSFQNRLRHGDYRALLQAAGFEVIAEIGQPDEKALADVRTLPLAGRFQHHSFEDLAILSSVFLARRP